MTTKDEVLAACTQAQRDALDSLLERSHQTREDCRISYDPVFHTLFLHDFAGMLVGIEADGYTHT